MKKINIWVFMIMLLLIQYDCKKVPFYAGEGATLTISADRCHLQTGGDRTQLTVMGFDDKGQALYDHTRVVFSATLGTVSPMEIELIAGGGVVEFTSGDRNGVAEIRARSANIKAEPDPLQITIGAAALNSLSLSATPSRFDHGGGRSHIRAYAFDGNGNLLNGIRLVLSTTSGYFENAAPVYITNSEGMVQDFLNLTETATVKVESGEKKAEVEIIVDPETENQLPQSNFSFSPSSPVRGETVNFNGESSTDPDGSVTSWNWDFGDGRTGTGVKIGHSFSWEGKTNRTFTVTLKVTDNRGGISVSDKSITVEVEASNQQPNAEFTYSPLSPKKEERIYFNGSLSSDPDGTISSWLWDFGDGHKGRGKTIAHIFYWDQEEDRVFTVTLTVADDSGAQDVIAKTITVKF